MRIFFPREGTVGFIATSLHLPSVIPAESSPGLPFPYHIIAPPSAIDLPRNVEKTLYLNRSAVKREGRGSCHQ